MTASVTHGPRHRSRPPAVMSVVLAASLVVTSACTANSADRHRSWSAGELTLVSFDSCESAAERLRAAARAQVGPWGFGQGYQLGAATDVAMDSAGDDTVAGAPPPAAARQAAPEAAALEPAAPAGGAHSSTNVHEAGVDEPDLVKTDGTRIVTVTDGVLRVVDAAARVQTGSLALTDGQATAYHWYAADLLLHGDRALVLLGASDYHVMPEPLPMPRPGDGGDPVPLPRPVPEPMPIVGPRLLLVDLAGAPRVLSEYTVDGGLVDARAVGQTVRVVVRSAPRLEFPAPSPGSSERQRRAANRKVVAEAEVTDWLPRYQVTTGGATSTGQVDCAAVSHPVEYSGTSMLTVLTFDLAAPALGDGAPVSVVADGDTVYSNGSRLYIASDQRWQLPDGRGQDEPQTAIYAFDLTEPGPPRYVAAGAVDGWLINQYAMSEWDGHLRVATTSGDVWGFGPDEPDSSSAVYVLAQRGGQLVEVGAVGDLGYGERIYSVRYSGPVGYVVTFRETDPLYTLDLRDPSAPRVLGELKITGYSAYLHDLGGGLLLGVGQEADLRGVVQGTQVSLFDVSALGDPRLQDQYHVRFGQSEAEFDPHAFLWWPAERLVVIPLMAADGIDSGPARPGGSATREAPLRWQPWYGALVLRVVDGALVEQALVEHPASDQQWGGHQIRRSLVIGDTLWTVSSLGLQANDLTTLDPVAWLPFR